MQGCLLLLLLLLLLTGAKKSRQLPPLRRLLPGCYHLALDGLSCCCLC